MKVLKHRNDIKRIDVQCSFIHKNSSSRCSVMFFAACSKNYFIVNKYSSNGPVQIKNGEVGKLAESNDSNRSLVSKSFIYADFNL